MPIPRGLEIGKGPALLFGLGNPGQRYALTRHNVGFLALDAIAGGVDRFGACGSPLRIACLAEIAGVEVLLVKPQTFMNGSGLAVAEVVCETSADAGKVVVIYDDVELPFGTIRVRERGSDAGHNGMRSILETLDTREVPRIRIGVGEPDETGSDLRDHVLGEMSDAELRALPAILGLVREALGLVVIGQIGKAMSLYNRRPAAGEPGAAR
ncbi:MAG: aminoacyl-tRNA hydrolase [Acidobacteriota bacterium]